MKTDAGDAFANLMKPIEELVNDAESLEQLLEDLLSLEETLDTTEFEAVMGQALAAAELAGRFDVSEGQ